jgi:hypothetical protein
MFCGIQLSTALFTSRVRESLEAVSAGRSVWVVQREVLACRFDELFFELLELPEERFLLLFFLPLFLPDFLLLLLPLDDDFDFLDFDEVVCVVLAFDDFFLEAATA